MGKVIVLAACAIALAACGGSQFSGLGPAAALGDGGGETPAADGARAGDAGDVEGDAEQLGPDGSPASSPDSAPPSRADAAPVLEDDAGDGKHDAGGMVTSDAGDHQEDAGGHVACSSAAACPSCGSAVSYPCCSAGGVCGCTFTAGGTCTVR